MRYDDIVRHPLEKGWHTEVETPHLFIDGCMQIWPDVDFGRLHRYGVAAYCVTAFRPHHQAPNALDAMADWWRVARTYPNVRIALTAEDIVEAKRQGQAALVLVSQGGDFIGQNLHRLDVFHRLGLRMMIPVYNVRGPLGDGCLEPQNGGLSRLGICWVEECERLGIVIDLTHVGERTSLEIMERATRPLVFSHSNPKALVDGPRNITDEQMRRCAEGGGVVGVTNWGPLNFRSGSKTRPTLAQYFEAVDHVVQLVGIDHVAIGTDMSHGTYPDGDLVRARPNAGGAGYPELIESSPRSRLRYVEGFDDYGQIAAVAEALQARGYSEADVKKILGENFLRVFRAVWGG